MIIVEVDYQNSTLMVEKDEHNLYHLSVGGKVTQPNHDAEGIMRALAHYLHNSEYQLQKLKKMP